MPEQVVPPDGRAPASLSSLRVRLLGDFRVYRGEQLITEPEWKRKKAKSLFKLLLAPLLGAEYRIDGGASIAMTAADSGFNSPTENLTAGIAPLPTGVYDVCVRGTDAAGNIGSDECILLAVYDPSAGFVTGGGWINSPAGAYPANPALAGKATFGFVSKYQKGATVPTGQTEFQFRVANLNFHSDGYQWLVVSGARAQYKGWGTINGAGDHGFILTAIDGQVAGGGGSDKFRIKIWQKDTGAIVYDNQMGVADTADPSTTVAGGSIVVHTK